MGLEPYRAHAPQIDATAYVHAAATVIGWVEVGAQSSIWPTAVLRGDDGAIRIGAQTSIQDGSVVHMTTGLSEVSVGDRVTVGHKVILHGCKVEDECLIGMGAIILDNAVIGRVIGNLRTSVEEGMGLAAPLKSSGWVPALVVQMVSAGEESGTLDEMLVKVADYYDEEVDRAVTSLSASIEPILIVCMGGMVLFVALAIFMPMWDMSQMARTRG